MIDDLKNQLKNKDKEQAQLAGDLKNLKMQMQNNKIKVSFLKKFIRRIE